MGTEPTSSVTIYDIAEAAGVSPSTVSRAFSRPDRVSFVTAEKIRTIAEELGYRTKLETRNSVRTTKDTVGFIAADLANPFFVEVLRGASHAGWVEDVWIHASDVQESSERSRAAVDKLIGHVDGLLLASARLTNSEIQKIARTVPTVVINRPVNGVPSVLVDSYDGSIRLAAHLADQGAKTVTYLSWPEESWMDSMRWRGLREATGNSAGDESPLFTKHIPLSDERLKAVANMSMSKITLESPTTRGGRRAFIEWKARPTDAVVCFNDLVAIGFLHQAAQDGVRVPDDVLVAGFDNNEAAQLSSPGLTTVAGPLRSIGRVAAANLIALVQGIKKPMAKPRVLPTRLIVRESTSLKKSR